MGRTKSSARSVPAGWERCIGRAIRVSTVTWPWCLQKAPAQRFQTTADVRTALEQVAVKPADPQPSIAVLPFANMSADKENE